uniref:Uncharacterized protein n=1 Tax=Arundo donax TaxID=35708 RepID=A0A0A9HSB8_ARUDO
MVSFFAINGNCQYLIVVSQLFNSKDL